jgi:hypothetical protein
MVLDHEGEHPSRWAAILSNLCLLHAQFRYGADFTHDMTTREAAEVMALIATHCKTLELTDIEARLTALEKRLQP